MSRRRRFTPAFKAQVVLKVLTGAKNPAQVCREQSIRGSLLSRWRQEFLEHAPQAFDRGRTHSQCEERVPELERLVGRLTMELEIAKNLTALDLPTERKRELAAMLSKEEHYPVTTVCNVLGLPRSTYYHGRKEGDEQALRAAIEAIVSEFPTYGSRRVAAQLRRAPYEVVVNRKRVQRLMREMGLQQPVKRKKCRTTNSQHPYPRYPNLVDELAITYPDQVWVSDITYIRLRSEFIYLAVIMDVFTRAIRGWHLSRWLDQGLTLVALRRALADHVPVIHHSDQGVQYAAGDYIDLLREHHIQISMAAQGNPEENGYAERLIRTIKEEEVDLSEYEDFADALAQIGHFIEEVYQRKRIHSALGADPGGVRGWLVARADSSGRDVFSKIGRESVQL